LVLGEHDEDVDEAVAMFGCDPPRQCRLLTGRSDEGDGCRSPTPTTLHQLSHAASAPAKSSGGRLCNGANIVDNNEPEAEVAITNRKRFEQVIPDLHRLHEKLIASIEQNSQIAVSMVTQAAKAGATTAGDSDIAPAFSRAIAALSAATTDAAAGLPRAADSIKAVADELETFYHEVTGTDDAAAEDVKHE
jgi:hypothetical protein